MPGTEEGNRKHGRQEGGKRGPFGTNPDFESSACSFFQQEPYPEGSDSWQNKGVAPGAQLGDGSSLAFSSLVPFLPSSSRPQVLTQHRERKPPLGPPGHVLSHAAVAPGVDSPSPLHVQPLTLALQPQARLGPHWLAVPLPRHPGRGFPCGIAFQSGLLILDHGHLCVWLPGARDLRGNWHGEKARQGRWAAGHQTRATCQALGSPPFGLCSSMSLAGCVTLAR